MDPSTHDNNIDDVKALIESGFDIETKYGQLGATILQYAALRSHVSIVKYLLDIGANVNTIDTFGDTPLHDAARARCIDIVECLLENGADKFAKNNYGYTAFEGSLRHEEIGRYIESFELIPTKGVHT
jgi:ankyrin repeat protein